MRISDWSSDVCSSDLDVAQQPARQHPASERAVARLAQQRIVERLGFMPVRRCPVVPVGMDLGEYRLQAHRAARVKIGRASCRERVCQYVSISVVAASLYQKHTNVTTQH